jgi:hypothetical protein
MLQEEGQGAARRPGEVALWGVPDWARDYLACLRDAGIGTALWVDARHAGGEIEGVRVVSPAEYARRCHLYAGLPIVVTARGPEDTDGFNEALLAVVNELELPGRFLHPVFVADHLGLDYRGRVVLGGLPGSGEGTVRDVVARLVARCDARLGSRETLLAGLAADYHFHTLVPAIDGLFNLGGRYASLASTIGGDRIGVEMRLAGDRLATVCDLRSRTVLHEPVHATPEPLTPEGVGRFRGLNATVLAILRHPLDVLVANAARLCRAPERVLGDESWFRRMAGIVKEYYAHVLGQQDRGVTVVRYERLLESAAEEVRRIGRALGLDLGRGEAEAVWSEAGFRSAGPTGAGRWREVLGGRHMGVLEELGYGAFLRELGYDTRLEAAAGGARSREPAEAPEPREPAEPEPQRWRREAAYGDFWLHVLYGKPVNFRYDGFTCERDRGLGITVLTSDPTLWDLMKVGLASRYFRRLVMAAGARPSDGAP